MNTIIKEVCWNDVKNDCDKLYNKNSYLSPYQEWSFLDKIKNTTNIHRFKEWLFSKIKIYEVFKDGEVVCILPLQINKQKMTINILGYLCGVGQLDFIYGENFSQYDFNIVIKELSDLFKGYNLILERVSQYSLTHRYIEQKKCFYKKKQSICVRIDYGDYETWFKGLSKSTRQNLRTAYNRISREERKLDIFIYVNELPASKMVNDNLELFSIRTLEHNHLSTNLYPIMLLLKKNETFSKALLSSMNYIGGNIYLDDKIFAICNGLISNDGRAIITRLSIDTTRGVYCPGGIILNELIKKISESYPYIKSIDLSRGDEKYKYTYGGYEHYIYDYIIPLK